MKLLVDTHALIWLFEGSDQLSRSARQGIEDEANDVFVSAVSAWEMATKYRLGKLNIAAPLLRDFGPLLQRFGFIELSVTVAHGAFAGSIEPSHKDPFDRMLAAQAIMDDLLLVSNDRVMDSLDAQRMWSTW